jgi:hypothetical protein
MPVSPGRDPFNMNGSPSLGDIKPTIKLRLPQARVLAVLVPPNPSDPPSEWASVPGKVIAYRLGTSEVSDYIRRAMRGLREGSPSGTPHKGLLALGYATEYVLDIEGLDEIHYQITAAGIAAITEYLKHNKLPPVRNASLCTNDRYREDKDGGTAC